MNLLYILTGESTERYAAAAGVISVVLALLGGVFLLGVLLTVVAAHPLHMSMLTVISGFFFGLSVLLNGVADDPLSTLGEAYQSERITIYAIGLMTLMVATVLVVVAVIERFAKSRYYSYGRQRAYA
jgi:uncharacterized membrane protein